MSINWREFVTGGNATFSIAVPEADQAAMGAKPHYTYKVRRKEAEGGYPEAYFISLLTGPDNESSFTYMGMLAAPSGQVRLTKASSYNDSSVPVRLARFILAQLWGGEALADGYALNHDGRCCRCGRKLTTPESVERGIGPECWARSPGNAKAKAALAQPEPAASEAGPFRLSDFSGSVGPGYYSAEASDLGLQGWPESMLVIDERGTLHRLARAARPTCSDDADQELMAFAYDGGDIHVVIFND